MNFTNTLSILSVLYILVALGYICTKTGFLNYDFLPGLTQYIVKVALPCTFFISLQRKYEEGFLQDSILILILSFAIFFITVAAGYMISKVLKISKEREGTWIYSSIFTNGALIGYPAVTAVFGIDALSFAALINIPYCLFLNSYGVYILTKDLKSNGKEKLTLGQILILPTNLGIFAGLLFMFMQWELPSFLLTPVNMLANTTTPIAMVIIGMTLSSVKVKEIFIDKDALTGTFVRLLIFPAIAFAITSIFYADKILVMGAMMTICATPTAATVPTFCSNYGADECLASKITFLTSVFSLITLPLWFMLC